MIFAAAGAATGLAEGLLRATGKEVRERIQLATLQLLAADHQPSLVCRFSV